MNKPFEYITEEEWQRIAMLTGEDTRANINEFLTSKEQTQEVLMDIGEESFSITEKPNFIMHYFLEPLKPAEPVCDHKINIEINYQEGLSNYKAESLGFDFCPKCGKPLGGSDE